MINNRRQPIDIIKGSFDFNIVLYHLCFLILIFKNPNESSEGLIRAIIKGNSGVNAK